MREIYHRTVDEIMEEIRIKAQSYTPEWRFDRKDPDIGTALAEIYAGLQSGLDRKYSLLPSKFKIDYFNCLNTSMKTASPAEGYVVFGLSGEDAESSVLTAGTLLRSDSVNEEGESVPVELTEDVCVIRDTLEAIYETNGFKDYIGLQYDLEMEDAGGFPLFGMSAGNMERHVFYLNHPWMFRIRHHANIVLGFCDADGYPLPEEQLSRFTDNNAVRFFYETGEDVIEYLPEVRLIGGLLWIKKQADSAPWQETEHAGITDCWLGCEILDIRGLEGFNPYRVTLALDCPAGRADAIFAAGADQPVDEPVMAFGENFSVYDELYIGSGDILSKRGAEIELSFDEEFVRIPIETEDSPDFDWKLVMPKEQFRPEKQYDITIDEVIWEYYNGTGWARLFPGNENRDVFSTVRGTGRQIRKINFICPNDLQSVLAGSSENYYIRARIMKVSNAFRTTGQYLAPLISDVRLSCHMSDNKTEPEYMYAVNNLEEEIKLIRRERQAGTPLGLVRGLWDTRASLYLGFGSLPEDGPVRLLWEMAHTMSEGQPEVRWEYFAEGGWVPLRPADGTENFRMTGTVSFSGIPDAQRYRLFGRELYWLRVVRTGAGGKSKENPEIRAWYLNAARAITLRHGITEYLTLEGWEEGPEFQLLNHGINTLELWVREDERLTRAETEELKEQGRYREILDENGGRSGAWIRWEQTDSLRRHGPSERVYLLNENAGILTFGGGANGKLPAPDVIDGIRVTYSIGGGKSNCLPENTVTGLELAEGYVSTVFNPMPLYGGYDRETVHTAMRRAAGEVRTGFRAVTEHDFEELAMGYMGNIRRAKCLSGVNQEDQPQAGAVTLALLTDDYMDRGGGFENVKKRLYSWFEDKLPATLKTGRDFYIREPELVEISLQIEALIEDYQDLYRIQKNLQEKLDSFLDPISGNFNGRGWEIGTLPDRIQLETLIRSTDGIDSLQRCLVMARLPKRPGSPSIAYEEIRSTSFVMPVGGKHAIRLMTKD